MKKIFSIAMIIALVALIFTFAACGDNNANNNTTTSNTTNKMTSLKDEGSSMMDDMSSALGELADDLTQGGNVTDNQSSTGLLEGLTSNNTESTSDGDSAVTTNAADTTAASE